LDKKSLLQRTALSVLEAIFSLDAVEDPSKLFTFVLLTYADLKGYRFTYWCGIPAIIPDTPFTADPPRLLRDATYEGGFNLCLYLYKALGAWLSQSQARDSDTPDSAPNKLQSIFALRFSDLIEEGAYGSGSSGSGCTGVGGVGGVGAGAGAGGESTVTESSLTEDDGNDGCDGDGNDRDGIMLQYAPAEFQIHLVDPPPGAEILTLSQAWPLRHSRSVYFVVMGGGGVCGAGANSAEEAAAGGMSWVVRNFLAMVAVHRGSYGSYGYGAYTDAHAHTHERAHSHTHADAYEHSDQAASDLSVRVVGFSGALATMLNR
jgi:hypothetical protein